MENANVEKLNKEPMSTKQKVVFGLKIAGNVVFYVIIILLFLFSLMNINAGGKGGIPNLFGKGYLSVQSDSMSRQGNKLEEKGGYADYSIKAFNTGDLLKVNILNDKEKEQLKVGDVITYTKTINGQMVYVTHRIVLVTYKDDKLDSITLQGDKVASQIGIFDPENIRGSYSSVEEAQQKAFTLQGMKDTIDVFDSKDFSMIKAKVTGVKHGWGNVMDNIQRNWLWYFVLPVLALLLFEIFMVVKNFMDLKAEKQKATMASDKEAMLAEIAAEKERMRQELLEELKSQQDSNNESKEEDSTIQEEESKEE